MRRARLRASLATAGGARKGVENLTAGKEVELAEAKKDGHWIDNHMGSSEMGRKLREDLCLSSIAAAAVAASGIEV